MVRRKDRRKYPRVKVYNLLKYKVGKDRAPRIAKGGIAGSKDISQGGVSFRADAPLEKGAIVELAMNIPGIPSSPSSLAKVVWVRKMGGADRYEIGVEFLDIDKEVQTKIQRRIEITLANLLRSPTVRLINKLKLLFEKGRRPSS